MDAQEFGRLQATVEHLEREVSAMRADMSELLALANRGKGAIFAGMAIAGVIGSAVTWTAERLLR